MNSHVFSSIVSFAFATIISRFGFSIVASGDYFVRLDSCNVSIDVYYDWDRSYEVDIGICQYDDQRRLPEIPYNLGEIFREYGAQDAKTISFFQSNNQSSVEAYLRLIADRLSADCFPLLRGDKDVYFRLGQRRSVEAQDYTHNVQLASVRDKVDEAWRSKEYSQVVSLLSGFKEWLPEPYKSRLEFAVKRSGSRPPLAQS